VSLRRAAHQGPHGKTRCSLTHPLARVSNGIVSLVPFGIGSHFTLALASCAVAITAKGGHRSQKERTSEGCAILKQST
jgi:hypothetical protein